MQSPVTDQLRGSTAWPVAGGAACALLAIFVFEHLPGLSGGALSGDTIALVHGARTIAYCLAHGIHSYCDQVGAVPGGAEETVKSGHVVRGGVGAFPLFQYIPALLLTQVGMSNLSVYRAFSVISLVGFCALIVLAARTAARTTRPWAAPVTVLVFTTSPLLYYAWSTFGESLAALLIALLAVAALRRWPPLVLALCAFLACITKETVFPIVAILGAVSLCSTPIGAAPLRRLHWIGLASGVLVAIAASAIFNWFRFHQLTNHTYLQAAYQVPGVGRKLMFSIALWVAPNGGLAVFWPVATVMMLGLVAIAVGATRDGVRRRRSVPALSLAVALLVLTGTLASWWAPFGWWAWGPRLMLPPLPAIVLIFVVLYGKEIEGSIYRVLATRARTAVVSVLVIAVALPQVNVLHASEVASELFLPDAVCPTVPSISAPAYYYHCIDHLAWGRHMIVIDSFNAFGRLGGVVFAIAFALSWAALIAMSGAGRGTREQARDRRPGLAV